MVACLWSVSLLSFNLVVLSAVIACSSLIWVMGRIPVRGLKLPLAVLTGMSALFVVFNGFFYFSGVTPLFSLGELTFTLEGALFGLAVSVKMASVVAAVPILAVTTPVSQLMAALAMLRLPYKFIFALGTAMRFVPLVQETYADIRDAQRLRAHDVAKMKLFSKLTRGYLPVMVPLFLSLLRKSQDMDVAIESRAFGAPVKRTYVESVRLGPLDWLLGGTVFLLCVALIAGSVYFGLEGGLTGVLQPLQ